MCYRVYLWKTILSQEAEVFQTVQAASPDLALQAVMQAAHLPYAHFAWVVPDDDDVPCVQRFRVRCASARGPGH